MEGTDDFADATANFLTWLNKKGIKMSHKMKLVDFRMEGRGRGVVATDDFAEDEVVFSIPRTAVLNVRNSIADNQHGNSGAASDVLSSMSPWLALTAVMISEGTQTDSEWGPYLAVLPRELNSLVFWDESELDSLQASAVVKKIGRKSAEDMFSTHISPLGLNGCNIDLCHRVASIIMAYAFDIPDSAEERQINEKDDAAEDGEDLVSDNGDDEKTVLSMIPLADMLNADADRNNARLCCDNEDLEMRTIKPILKGEEIFNDYGQLPQSDLLRRYGYQSDNYATYDVAEISTESIMSAFQNSTVHPALEKLSSDALERRLELAQREDIFEESYDIAHADENGPSIPDELLALLYLLLIDEENLEAVSTSQASLPSRSKMTTELVGQVLAFLLEQRGKEYGTTLEEDEQLLQQGNLSIRETMAIKVRMGEKAVIKKAILDARAFEGSNKRMRVREIPQGHTNTETRKGKRTRDEPQRSQKKRKT
ncbi:Ribosomal lysine N-methyltransferase 4 [Phlyctema vagabunda]|uniref:Ribosomal lysine N-methyltransferase 4 n=1 Tax=Phlyctema vagabunda TaxID=108571 RepID=A0ABR4PQF8_9HELO